MLEVAPLSAEGHGPICSAGPNILTKCPSQDDHQEWEYLLCRNAAAYVPLIWHDRKSSNGGKTTGQMCLYRVIYNWLINKLQMHYQHPNKFKALQMAPMI